MTYASFVICSDCKQALSGEDSRRYYFDDPLGSNRKILGHLCGSCFELRQQPKENQCELLTPSQDT